MPFNLLILPALGGYFLLRYWNRTRYFLARLDGYRFVLWVAVAAVTLLGLASLLVALAYPTAVGAGLATGWHHAVPFAHSGKAFGAFVLGIVAPHVLNRVPRLIRFEFPGWNDANFWARRALAAQGNELELLLARALSNESPVMATLSSGKVYVGFVTRSLRPGVERRYLRLLPVVSGYRESGTQRVTFTTPYEEVRAEADDLDSPLYGLLSQDFEVVLPIGDIVSANLFDFVAYEAFEDRS